MAEKLPSDPPRGIQIDMAPYGYQPTDEEIGRERLRIEEADRKRRAKPPLNPLPETLSTLRSECERCRCCIVGAMRGGEKLYPGTDENILALLKGHISGYPLPSFERLWSAAILVLEDAPPFPGEPRSGPDAIAAVDGLIAAIDKASPPLDTTKPATSNGVPGRGRPQAETNRIVEEYLAKHPDAKIGEVVKGTGCSTGAVQKSPAWRKVNEERKTSRPAGKSQPLIHQLRNEGEASILTDNGTPLDNAIRNEEEAKEATWRGILDLVDPQDRRVLNILGERERGELVQYATENDHENTKAMIQLIVERKREEELEEEQHKQRSPRRSRSYS